MNIPVMRLNMATGAPWESVVTDAIRKVCEPFLNDERRAADGRHTRLKLTLFTRTNLQCNFKSV